MQFSLRTLVIVMLLGVGLALAEVGWWRLEGYRKAEIEAAKFDWSILRPWRRHRAVWHQKGRDSGDGWTEFAEGPRVAYGDESAE